MSAGSRVPVPDKLSIMLVLTAVSNVYVEVFSAVFFPSPQDLTAAAIMTIITTIAIIFFSVSYTHLCLHNAGNTLWFCRKRYCNGY